MVSHTARNLFQSECLESLDQKPTPSPTSSLLNQDHPGVTRVSPCKIVGDEEKLDEVLQVLIQRRQPVLLIDRKTQQCFMADPRQVLRWRHQKRMQSASPSQLPPPTKSQESSCPSLLPPTPPRPTLLPEQKMSFVESPTSKFCPT
jgi:hypothetical protein